MKRFLVLYDIHLQNQIVRLRKIARRVWATRFSRSWSSWHLQTQGLPNKNIGKKANTKIKHAELVP